MKEGVICEFLLLANTPCASLTYRASHQVLDSMEYGPWKPWHTLQKLSLEMSVVHLWKSPGDRLGCSVLVYKMDMIISIS
jgi:hypothetical protein